MQQIKSPSLTHMSKFPQAKSSAPKFSGYWLNGIYYASGYTPHLTPAQGQVLPVMDAADDFSLTTLTHALPAFPQTNTTLVPHPQTWPTTHTTSMMSSDPNHYNNGGQDGFTSSSLIPDSFASGHRDEAGQASFMKQYYARKRSAESLNEELHKESAAAADDFNQRQGFVNSGRAAMTQVEQDMLHQYRTGDTAGAVGGSFKERVMAKMTGGNALPASSTPAALPAPEPKTVPVHVRQSEDPNSPNVFVVEKLTKNGKGVGKEVGRFSAKKGYEIYSVKNGTVFAKNLTTGHKVAYTPVYDGKDVEADEKDRGTSPPPKAKRRSKSVDHHHRSRKPYIEEEDDSPRLSRAEKYQQAVAQNYLVRRHPNGVPRAVSPTTASYLRVLGRM